MDTDKRLKSLRMRVNYLRNQGNIKSFPEDLRREALELVNKLGASVVAKEVKLSSSIFYTWRNNTSMEKVNHNNIENIDLRITRIISDKKPENKTSIASIKRGEIEINFFDPAFASTILKEILL